jgi:pimeloyl-ACP methyl ester carboxylesterase
MGLWLAGIIGAPIAAVLAALGLRALLQARVAASLRIRAPNGIDETGLIRIGGIEQWVSIRGEDRANPVIVMAHGGPGNGFSPFIGAMRAWEPHFTIVHWDQRGAGLTYSRAPKGQGEVTLDRIVEDGIEVTQHALKRTGQTKAVILGMSWGTVVGVVMARRRPELFHAFVGGGQVVDMVRNEVVGYASLLERVRAADDGRSEAELLALGSPPYSELKQTMAERRVLARHPPASERGVQGRIAGMLLTAPHLTLRQIWDWVAASGFSLKALLPTLEGYSDWPPAPFAVPVVVIQGADDIQTPASLAAEYVEAIQAPSKRYVSLPGGGHYAMLAMADDFLAALLTEVRPLAVSPPSPASGP